MKEEPVIHQHFQSFDFSRMEEKKRSQLEHAYNSNKQFKEMFRLLGSDSNPYLNTNSKCERVAFIPKNKTKYVRLCNEVDDFAKKGRIKKNLLNNKTKKHIAMYYNRGYKMGEPLLSNHHSVTNSLYSTQSTQYNTKQSNGYKNIRLFKDSIKPKDMLRLESKETELRKFEGDLKTEDKYKERRRQLFISVDDKKSYEIKGLKRNRSNGIDKISFGSFEDKIDSLSQRLNMFDRNGLGTGSARYIVTSASNCNKYKNKTKPKTNFNTMSMNSNKSYVTADTRRSYSHTCSNCNTIRTSSYI